MTEATTKVLTTADYLRVLDDERLLTFAVTVDGRETHHQLSIADYPDAPSIEQRIAEVAAQVLDEMTTTKALERRRPIPADIRALVDKYMIAPEAAAALPVMVSANADPA